jgi:hypothetical protein
MVKISRPPKARDAAPKGRHAWRRLSRQPLRRRVRVELTYRGGASAFVEVRARGITANVQGYVPLYDLLLAITANL